MRSYSLTARISVFAAVLLVALTAPVRSDESNAIKIQRALAAGPSWIRAHAAVVIFDSHGTPRALRQGTNGFTCVPGTPGVISDDPMCMDPQGTAWVEALMAHKAKPANTAPGVVYLLTGGTSWGVTDPWATSGKALRYPPCMMVVWPFDSKTSGLPTHYSASGLWIMWAGTSYAHLMVMGKP